VSASAPLSDQGSIVQNVTAVEGFAYGVIGADMHVLSEGAPLYVLENYLSPPIVDSHWLRELPSRMLSARFAVVKFTGRESERNGLLEWCRTGPQLAARWLHGPGGQGKTRLVGQVAEELIGRGWKVVTATHGLGAVLPQPGSQDMRIGEAPGVLLIVDYADRWSLTHLTWLLSNALVHQTATLARVLLVARTAEGWPTLRQSLARFQAGTSQQLLGFLPDEPGARGRAFIAARNSFAPHYGIADPNVIVPPARFDRPGWGLTLTVHMAALVAVDAHVHERPSPQDPVGLTSYLLDRERAHWTYLWKNRARAGKQASGLEFQTRPSVMSRAVFTASLTGPVSDAVGKTVLNSLDLELPSDLILTDHAVCYPPADARLATVLEPLYPDRLAEDFLGVTMPGHAADQPAYPWAPAVATTLLARGANQIPAEYTPRAIAFLAAAAERWPHVGETFLHPLLRRDPQLAVDAGSAALTAIADLPQIAIDVLEAIESRLPPERHVDLDPGIAVLVRRLTEHRLAASDEPGKRAQLYLNLGRRLSNAGDHHQALQATKEAVEIYRDLAAATLLAFEDDLAKALLNHGRTQLNVGRREEALAATEEAVELFRRLAADNPAGSVPDLAKALTNVGTMRSSLGRQEEALAATEEAMELFRRLAADNPGGPVPDLAQALLTLGMARWHLGRREEALAATEEAVERFRRLAADNPGGSVPDLAKALSNLGTMRSSLSRHEEALAASEEAVLLFRRLAAVNPPAFAPELAMSLNNLGARMKYLGRWEEALAATGEAVDLHRRLVATNPAAAEPGLAMSLANLGNDMSYLGRREEALAATTEALELYRRLAAANPATFEPELADSLNNLGEDLSGAGRLEEALAVTEEAVEIRRRLAADRAADQPTRFGPDLAGSLGNLGNHLSALGRRDEATAATREAVKLYRRLAASNPVFEPNLAAVLDNLGSDMSATEQREEGLALNREAVELYRRLALSNPTAFQPGLAEALSNLGGHMSLLGRREEALAATEEAVALHRSLAATNPGASEPGLAETLGNLGTCMSDLGRGEEALAATKEGVAIHRRLMVDNPAAFESHLARGLWGFGRVRAAVRLELPEALAAVQEAVTIYHRLARLSPVPFSHEIHEVKDTLADVLEELGRSQDAAAIRLEIADGDPPESRFDSQ
jgi:tetratricopeptide (TPR) repeat protein